LAEAIERSRAVLRLPDDHQIAIVPASDTGAMEMAMWSLLGSRPVDMLSWESFGEGWVTDVRTQLRLPDVRVHQADYGHLPDLGAVDFRRDVVFLWNGTTSGVRVPDGSWIAPERDGVTLCDATSAAFAMHLPWERLDATTYSWQKVLGGEAAHGMLILGPRAVERLERFEPTWPMPKIFRLTQGGALNKGLFAGATINTPSMLCVEDYLDALAWAQSLGGLDALVARSEQNLALLSDWVNAREWIEFLAATPEQRSCTSVCLQVTDARVARLPQADQRALLASLTDALAAEEVAFDIQGYRDAPPGLRIWTGPTVEADDLSALLPWLDWAWSRVLTEVQR